MAPPAEQWCKRAVVLIIVSCCVSVAFAQQPFGTVVGTVTDPNGATLAGVTMTITNTETVVSQTAVTSASGDYSIPYLLNGIYTIKAEQSGFRVAVISQLVVRAREGPLPLQARRTRPGVEGSR